MKNALVIGASGGIGRAVCKVLEADGVAVTRLSRDLVNVMNDLSPEQPGGLFAYDGSVVPW